MLPGPQQHGLVRRLLRMLVCAGVPLSLLAGCATGRDWHSVERPPDLAAVVTVIEKPPSPNPAPDPAGEDSPTPSRFSLPEAIQFALRKNPRLRAALARIERARGQEQVAFAPFLPQVGMLNRYVATSSALSPGAPGPTGGLLIDGAGPYSSWQSELQVQLTLYDFGRTGGRHQQAVLREQIARLQAERSRQTVAYDAAAAYFQGLEAAALRKIAEDSIRRAQAVLKDSHQRRAAGVAERDDVLRSEVQRAEVRDALVRAEEAELAALARLNNVMGRDASLPLVLIDEPTRPAFHPTLIACLEQAAGQRPEVGVARDRVAAAQFGRQAARAEFLPRIAVRGSLGHANGQDVKTGWQEGAALHMDLPLYHGGALRGELHVAEADIQQAAAEAQSILDDISLEVTLAYRGVMSARARVDLAQPAVLQARETLRIVRNRYRNGTATPTDVIDAETALTRAQQRYSSSSIEYLSALARLAYVMGCAPDTLLAPQEAAEEKAPRAPDLPQPRQVPEDG